MFRRTVTAPNGNVWTVRRRWPGTVAATTQGAYHYAGGMGWRESGRELERMARAIESGDLDARIVELADRA